MSTTIFKVNQAFGPVVEGQVLISQEGFSPRYDLDRWTGFITKPGHKLEGENIKDKICFFPTAKGGIAAGWAFYDIQHKGIAPKALIFGVTNPVMVQGAVLANIAITQGWSHHPSDVFQNGDLVRVDPSKRTIELIKKADRYLASQWERR
jgi:uncharacterized protein